MKTKRAVQNRLFNLSCQRRLESSVNDGCWMSGCTGMINNVEQGLTKNSFIIVALMAFFYSNIMAAEKLIYGGSGCPQNSATVTYNEEGFPLGIGFEAFEISTPPEKMSRKACDLALAVKVGQGKQISISVINFSGHNSIPENAEVELTAEIFFAGSQREVQKKTMIGPQVDNFSASFLSDWWSPCGQDVIVRVNASLVVNNLKAKESAFSSIENVGEQTNSVFNLVWRDCKE